MWSTHLFSVCGEGGAGAFLSRSQPWKSPSHFTCALEVKSQGQAEVTHRNREVGASCVSVRPQHSR